LTKSFCRPRALFGASAPGEVDVAQTPRAVPRKPDRRHGALCLIEGRGFRHPDQRLGSRLSADMDAAAGLLPEAEAAIQDRRATRLCAAVKKVRTQGFRKGGV